MPIELFDHDRLTISRETSKTKPEFQHYFGGSAKEYGLRFVNADHPCHVVYWLDTTDPLVPFSHPNIRFLPLVHGFQYSSNGFEFIYRILNEQEIEIIAPDPLEFNKDFPYDNYPPHFEKTGVSFESGNYKPKDAESALEYQGVFGIDQLSKSELQRAIEIARKTWHPERFTDFDWSDEEVVRIRGCDPFVQATPSDSCENPNCTAEVDRVIEAYDLELDSEVLGESKMHIDKQVILVSSLKVIAIHQPHNEDETMWGCNGVQLFWQQCTQCRCITVNNQCD